MKFTYNILIFIDTSVAVITKIIKEFVERYLGRMKRFYHLEKQMSKDLQSLFKFLSLRFDRLLKKSNI